MIIQTNMTQEEKAKAYDKALERARKIHSKIVNDELLGFPGQIEDIFPELHKEEKPLTSFQQCLNCILRGVYYAEVPDEKVNEFILNVVRTRTEELIKLAKKQEEQKHPDGCFTCDEYKKGYEAGRLNGFTAGYNKAMKEQKPAEKQDYSDLNDLERAIHRGFLAAGVENVPVGIIKETAKDCLVQIGLIRYELPEDFEEAVFKVVNFVSPFSSEEELREISHRFAEQLLSLAKEEVQKPTWSEEDNIGWDEAFACVTRTEKAAKNEEELQNAVTAEKWLKEIKFKYSVHSNKQEWSEEDSINLNSILNHLKEYLTNDAYTYYENWLKFLPERFNPQLKQEWSEEDEKIIDTIVSVLGQYIDYKAVSGTGSGYATPRYSKEIDWLKSLRPSWKPSEEQMGTLERWLLDNEFKGDSRYVYPIFESLYSDLKKLM